MDSTPENRWADPDTLLGMLQRGRGEGYRRSLVQRDDGSDSVVECIIHDPRLDRQVESRGWFYAALVAELNVDLSLLRAAYTENAARLWNDVDWDAAAWLATEVFELAAKRGISGGVTELRRYLRSGRDVVLALDHLLPLATHPEAFGLLEDILETANAEQLRGALSWFEGDFTAAPWPSWRRASTEVDEVVRDILSERATLPQPVPVAEIKRRGAVATRDLLVRTGRDAKPGTFQARLVELADGRGEDALRHRTGASRGCRSREGRQGSRPQDPLGPSVAQVSGLGPEDCVAGGRGWSGRGSSSRRTGSRDRPPPGSFSAR